MSQRAGKRPSRRPVLFVSFSGIDGAGKSTQIDHLRTQLERSGLQVTIVTFWDQVARLKGLREGAGHKIFHGDAGVGTPEAPISRRDKNVRHWWLTFVRLALYTVDAMSLRRIHERLSRGKVADAVIFDRYIYDELANLALRSSLLRLYVRTVLRIAPRPQAPLLLDAIPAEARARKPEYPLDFLLENRAAYLQLSHLADLAVIPPLPIEQAKQAVIDKVLLRANLDGFASQAERPTSR